MLNVMISEEFIYYYFNQFFYIPVHFPVSDAPDILLLSLLYQPIILHDKY